MIHLPPQDEFCFLTGDDTCDLLSLVDLYKDDPGDQDMLAKLLYVPESASSVHEEDESHMEAYFAEHGITSTDALRQSIAPPTWYDAKPDAEERGAEGAAAGLAPMAAMGVVAAGGLERDSV